MGRLIAHEIPFFRTGRPRSAELNGITPLHIAAELGDQDIAVALLQPAGDPNALDYGRRPPLFAAGPSGCGLGIRAPAPEESGATDPAPHTRPVRKTDET